MTPTRKMLLRLLWLGAVTGALGARASYAAPAINVVKVTASKFHFSPDRIVLRKGVTNTLLLTSSDTTHGFLLRPFNLDLDLAPGKITSVTLVPSSAGTFRAICDHYCGYGHGDMKLTVTVE